MKNIAVRQIKLVQPDATEEKIEDIWQSEGGVESLYKERILTGRINGQVRMTYNSVLGKYEDIRLLERSVAELHQMFLDMAYLTEEQGEILDHIEFHLKRTNSYVEDGNENTYKAIGFQRKIRKKQCWIMAIAVVGIVALLFFLILP